MFRLRTPLWAAVALVAALVTAPPAQAAAEPLTVTDFESATLPAGVSAWGNDTASTPALAVEPDPTRPGAPTTNRVLKAVYNVSQWGGWSTT